ncbi:MAG TPA: hypothetical protein VGM87_25610 [Roseomonas sp.]|jgi:hypothetical protein
MWDHAMLLQDWLRPIEGFAGVGPALVAIGAVLLAHGLGRMHGRRAARQHFLAEQARRAAARGLPDRRRHRHLA